MQVLNWNCVKCITNSKITLSSDHRGLHVDVISFHVVHFQAIGLRSLKFYSFYQSSFRLYLFGNKPILLVMSYTTFHPTNFPLFNAFTINMLNMNRANVIRLHYTFRNWLLLLYQIKHSTLYNKRYRSTILYTNLHCFVR